MAIMRTVPHVMRTSSQRLMVAQLLRNLEEYRMHENDDMISHIIKVNKMIQELIWQGDWTRQDNRVKLLRNTLPEMWHKPLTDIWESVRLEVQDISIQYNITLERFAVEYMRHGAKRTATPMISPSCRRGPRFVLGFPWLPKIQYKLPQEFKDSFPKTMITRDTNTGKILSVRY